MQKIVIDKHFNQPVEDLFAFLSDHNQLGKIFAPAKVRRIKDGTDGVNGTGSVRRLAIPGSPAFEETVIECIPNRRIVYRISRGSPMRNHEGVMTFAKDGERTSHLHYTIQFDSVVPGLALLVKVLLARSINKGLDRYANSLG